LKVVNVLAPWSWFRKQPQWRGFVDWKTYYTAPAQSLVQHGGPWVGDGARQDELINAVAAGRSASLVWAPPGCGKSRFALELARRIEKRRDRWQVVFVPHDAAAVREGLSEVARLKNIVFVVDDAHECPELVKVLAAASAGQADAGLHLVCLTRSTGRASVNQALQSAFSPAAVQEMDLGRPPAALVRTLIDQLLPKSSPLHRDTIARFVRQSFFLAVHICNLLSHEARLPQSFQRQDLRDRACRQPLKAVVEGVCPIEAATRALAVYAALVPVAKERSEVRDLAAELSGLAAASVATLIQRMLAAGLFREDQQGLIRPQPDLLGDLILEEACLDSQGKPTAYSKQLLTRLFESHPLATVTNCAEIGQLFGVDQNTDLVGGLLLSSARTATVNSRSTVLKLLRGCEPFAVRRPQTILEIAGLLEKSGLLRRAPPPEDLRGTDSIEWVVLGLLMRAAEIQPDIVPVAVQWGRDLYAAARGDDQSSEHVLALLRENCRFETGGPAHARAVVNTLQKWVSEPDVGAAVLASTLSAQFLTLEVDPAADVLEVRDVAVDTIVRAIARPESTVQYVALAALERYAYSKVALDKAQADRWRPSLVRELEKLAKAVSEVSKSTTRLPVWATAELRGWNWWMQESDALHDAGKSILTSIQSTDAYQLWKALHSQQLPVATVLPEDAKVSAASRVEYFQGLGTVRESDSTAAAQQLFDALDARLSDNDSWRTLWRTVVDQVPPMPLLAEAGAVIGEFARRHADAAWSFVNETDAQGPLFPLLPFLLDELGKQDRARRSEEARHVRPGTRLEEVWLRALGLPQELNEGERSLLARALHSSQVETMYHSARALLHASDSGPVEVFEAVFAAIERHPADGALWELMLERFAHLGAHLLPPTRHPPDESITQVANRLVPLMRASGSQLRWGFQAHTRQLDRVLAILAIASPVRLQEWIQQHWARPAAPGSGWNDASPLNISRLKSAMTLIRDSAVAAQWIDMYARCVSGARPLGEIAARGLSELCTLEHPAVMRMADEIAAHPSEASLQSLAELLGYQGSKSDFASQALALLEGWTRFPATYASLENVVVRTLVHQAGVRTVGQRALQAIETRRAGTSPAAFAGSLDRAEREIKETMGVE
jgi:hypothetical protein